jgi:hypothetical protein
MESPLNKTPFSIDVNFNAIISDKIIVAKQLGMKQCLKKSCR